MEKRQGTNGQTLGQRIGTVEHTFSITNDMGDKVQTTIKIDFSTSSDVDIKSWLASNRVIAGQRPWRALDKTGLEGLKNKVFRAESIGRKVESREKQIADVKLTFMRAGIAEAEAINLATKVVDNPEMIK